MKTPCSHPEYLDAERASNRHSLTHHSSPVQGGLGVGGILFPCWEGVRGGGVGVTRGYLMITLVKEAARSTATLSIHTCIMAYSSKPLWFGHVSPHVMSYGIHCKLSFRRQF